MRRMPRLPEDGSSFGPSFLSRSAASASVRPENRRASLSVIIFKDSNYGVAPASSQELALPGG